MKNKILNQIAMFSKWVFYGFVAQIIFTTVLLAATGNAQNIKSVKDNFIKIEFNENSISEAFKLLEDKTGYSFAYEKEEIVGNYKINRKYTSRTSVSKILLDFSEDTDLKFKQINNNIIVSRKNLENDDSESLEIVMQDIQVTGKVRSEDGNQPLPGATVIEKGTSNGVVTDIDGNYSLSVSANATLVFSYVGYLTTEVLIENRSTLDITLSPDIASLDEVVVIGYGQAEKREITSAVASVDNKEFNRGNVNDPNQLLQGKVAGLSIVKPGNDPNAGYNVRLRGLSTFGANSQPLVVIDGVLGGSLQLIDPNDIESIQVLKDASAAAIYGTRGASGVIIVTTKSAQGVDVLNVDYSGYVAVENVAKFLEHSTPEQFVEAGGQDIGDETDWYDLLTRTAVSHVHNFSVSNSTKSGHYRVSVNYRDIEGIALNSGFDQINSRLNLNQRAINDRLSLDFNLGVNLRKADFIPYETMRFAIIANPTAPIYDENDPTGYWRPNTPEYHNPYAIAQEVTDEGNFKTMLANFRADFEVIPGLNLAAFYSIQYESDMRSQYFSSRTSFTSADGQNGRATKFSEDRLNELFELTGTFQRNFGELNMNFVGGYSWQEFTFENMEAFNTNFITDDVLYNDLELGLGTATGVATSANMFSQKEESRLISFFGRAMFNYNDKYFLSASYRREGSSKFGPNYRWGDFYSVSGGVDLVQAVNMPADIFKLRVGYGITGNLPNENYEYLVRLQSSERTFYDDREWIQGVNFVSNPNPDLKWEEKDELDIGLDYAFLDSKIYGSIDYYTRNANDVLQRVAVDQPPNLYDITLINIGKLKSNGIEATFNYVILNNNNSHLTTGLVFSTFNTELVVLDDDRDQVYTGNLGPPGLNGVEPISIEEGEQIGDIYAPIFEGLDEDGNRILTDQNEDGTINQDDWVKVGNGLPDFELAWNTTFSWKNFDLNMLIRGAFGHSIVNINRAYYESPIASNNYNPVRTKYYLPDLNESENWNSYYVEEADFVKLDNITIGYNFPVAEKTFMRNLRLYITAQNLFVITGYTGVDPEVHYTYGNPPNPLAPGIDDRNAYFRTRTFTFGVNLGF